jgi:multidrug efflux pump subunit AcrA (membrane-fusion protein)
VANDTTTNSKDQLQTAKDNLAKATLTAPISGIISVVNVSIGNTPSGSGTTSSATTSSSSTTSSTSSGATAGSGGSTLFTIQSENAFKVNASVADYDVIQLSVGKEVETILDSTSDSYKGKILSVSPIANSSGNYDISASIENPSETALRVGMSAKVNIVLNKKDNTFVVPVDSIVEENGVKHVVLLDSSDPRNIKKTNIEVTTGMETDYYVEIFGNDLKVGQNIMNDPLNKSKTSQSAGSGGGPSILGGGPAASGGQ